MVLLIFGLYILSVGKVQVSAGRGLEGQEARMVGFMLLLTSLVPSLAIAGVLFVGTMIMAFAQAKELPTK